MDKSPDAFRTISEVAEWLNTPTHVLRFWESRFKQVKPVKRAGGRRYYRPKDMELLGGIKVLLHGDGLTIRGVQKLLREEGVRHVAAMSPPVDGSDALEGDYRETAHENDGQAAPIELDVPQVPVENVVPMVKPAAPQSPTQVDTQAATPTPDEQRPGNAPTSPVDDLADNLTNDAPTPVSAAPPQTTTATQEPETGPVSPSFSSRREPDRGPRGDILVGPDQTHPDYRPAPTPDPSAAPTVPEPAKRPLAADVPEDPSDNDALIPGILDVTAALRRAADARPRRKPDPQVFGELYERLSHLRHRMEKPANPKSID